MLDRVLFGDNQFFGVNHMSEEKARQQAMKFQDIEAIVDTLAAAVDAGVPGFMCTTHDRVAEIAEMVRAGRKELVGLTFYPCMPYAHKYANAVTELGYVGTLKKFLPVEGALSSVLLGSRALISQDVESVLKLLIDAEMKMFHGLPTPVVFLQNVVTDLALGLNATDSFRYFADHVRGKYGAEPGFITMNMPMLLPVLDKAGIKDPIICTNLNKIGFRMSGGVDAYREAAERYSPRVIAMSVFASGAIRPSEAIDWVVREPYVESIVFGASSRGNIQSTVSLIRNAAAA
jgi:hypothetical protein